MVVIVLANGYNRQADTTQTYKQAEYDLRITVSSLFRKAGLAQVVLIIRFKVKCGDIIELHTDISTERFRRMVHAYVLYDVVLMAAKLVKIAIDF